MSVLVYNAKSTTLASGLAQGATSVVLSPGHGLRSGLTILSIWNETDFPSSEAAIAAGVLEHVLISSISGNTATVVTGGRGFGGTTDQNHSTGGKSYRVAILTTVESLMCQRGLSVRAFGALGDGVTNDTAACQLAHNTAAALPRKPPVVYEPGKYMVSTLSIATAGAELKLVGDGPRRSVVLEQIAGTATGTPLISAGGVSGQEGPFIENMTLVSHVGSTLKLVDVRGFTGRDLYLDSDAPDDGATKFALVEAEGVIKARFFDFRVRGSGISRCFWFKPEAGGNASSNIRIFGVDTWGDPEDSGDGFEAGNVLLFEGDGGNGGGLVAIGCKWDSVLCDGSAGGAIRCVEATNLYFQQVGTEFGAVRANAIDYDFVDCTGVTIIRVNMGHKTETPKAIRISGCADVTVRDSRIFGNATGIDVTNSTAVLFEYSRILQDISDADLGYARFRGCEKINDSDVRVGPFGSSGESYELAGFYHDDLAASQSSTAMRATAGAYSGEGQKVAMRDGWITGIWVRANAAVTAGTATVRAKIAGTPIDAGYDLVLSTTNPQQNRIFLPAGAEEFSAGDTLDLAIESDGSLAPAGSLDIIAGLLVEYDA